MANQPPEITSLNANIGTITETVTVGGTLQWFSNSLVQRNFLPRHSAQGILGMGAVTADLKAGNLMDSVFAKIRGSRTAEERRRWFEEFVAIFSQDGAYAQLVEDLKSSAGIGAGGGDVGGAANEGVARHGRNEPRVTPKDFAGFPEPNLVDLMEMAGIELRAKWRDVGKKLGIEDYELDAYDGDYRGDSQRCMSKVFETWWNRDGHTSNYSWEKLAEVICSRLIDKGSLLPELLKRLNKLYEE